VRPPIVSIDYINYDVYNGRKRLLAPTVHHGSLRDRMCERLYIARKQAEINGEDWDEVGLEKYHADPNYWS